MNTVRPGKIGFSAARLGRIDDGMQRYIDEGKLAGTLTVLARHGQIAHCACHGMLDIEADRPMQPDAIFRIFSMTKPIVSVALLMLYEEGRFQLSDPVSRFIPAFKDVKVFVGETEEGIEVADLEREITLHDLMTHTSGLGYGLEDAGPVDALYQEAKILRRDEPLAEKMKRLADLPLWHQPGKGWTYSVATDVLGYVIEVIAGMPLDAYLKQRIFEPLGMVDTDFYVPQEKRDRLAALYTLDKEGHLTVMQATDPDDPTAGDWAEMAQRPQFLSGGGGLVSTAADYLRFGEMLRNGGAWNGVRLLGRKTVALMTMNHLPTWGNSVALTVGALHPFEDPAMGFGLGVGVLMDVAQSKTLGSPGTYGWGGAASTDFWVDPEEDLVGLLLLQFMPSGYYPIKPDFKVLTYQALID